jgi:hypothetical protein
MKICQSLKRGNRETHTHTHIGRMPFLIILLYLFVRKERGLQDDYRVTMNIVAKLLVRTSRYVQAERVIIDNKGKQMDTVRGLLNKHTEIS